MRIQARGPAGCTSKRVVQTANPSGFLGSARGASAGRSLPKNGQEKPPFPEDATWAAGRGAASLAVRNPPPNPAASNATAARTVCRPNGFGIFTPELGRVLAPL